MYDHVSRFHQLLGSLLNSSNLIRSVAANCNYWTTAAASDLDTTNAYSSYFRPSPPGSSATGQCIQRKIHGTLDLNTFSQNVVLYKTGCFFSSLWFSMISEQQRVILKCFNYWWLLLILPLNSISYDSSKRNIKCWSISAWSISNHQWLLD